MPGAPDPLCAKAREVLFDALEALGPHRSSLVLVGAQAIYPRKSTRSSGSQSDANEAVSRSSDPVDVGVLAEIHFRSED